MTNLSQITSRQIDRRRFLLGSAVLGSAAVLGGGLLSACSSDDEQTQTGTGGSTAGGDLTPVKLTLAYVLSTQFAGFLLAKERGYYADEGIDLTIQPGGASVNPFQLLVAGSTDIALGTYGVLLSVRDSGADIVNVAQYIERSAERMVYWADQPELADPKNWAGRTAAVFEGWQPTFAATVAKAGLTLDDVNVVQQTFDMTNFVNENVDLANAMIFNEYAQAIAGAQGREVAVFDYNEYGTSVLEHCIGVRPDWAADNKDLLVGFLRASMQGYMDARDEPLEAVATVMALAPALPEKYQTWQMNEVNKMIWPSTEGLFKVGPDPIRQSQELLYEYEVLNTPASDDSVDFSYRDEAASTFDEADLMGNSFEPLDLDPYTYFAD